MELPRNAFKAGLRAGRLQIGLWCALPDPVVVELLAGCGYDWLMIDTEHAPLSAAGTMPLLQAASAYPVSCLARPGWNDPVEIKRLLDCGAQTVLVPYVQSAAEGERAVAAVRYPPAGMRGVAGVTRATRWGAVAGYAARAGEEVCLLVQVETVEALARIEEIAAVPGVDGIFIGPADLAASMGHPGEAGHPEVRAAVLDAVARIRAAGQPAGTLLLEPEAADAAIAAGASFVGVGLDAAMLRGAALALRARWPAPA